MHISCHMVSSSNSSIRGNRFNISHNLAQFGSIWFSGLVKPRSNGSSSPSMISMIGFLNICGFVWIHVDMVVDSFELIVNANMIFEFRRIAYLVSQAKAASRRAKRWRRRRRRQFLLAGHGDVDSVDAW